MVLYPELTGNWTTGRQHAMYTRTEMETRHNEEIATMEFLHGTLPGPFHPYWQHFRDEEDAMTEAETNLITDADLAEQERIFELEGEEWIAHLNETIFKLEQGL